MARLTALLDSRQRVGAVRSLNRATRRANALNELAQAGVVSDIHYEYETHGPPHAPTFARTASLSSASERRRATEIGDTKAAAKVSAAKALLDQAKV